MKFDEFGVTWAFVDPRSELVRKSIFEPDHVDLGLDWKLVSAWTFLGLLGLVS